MAIYVKSFKEINYLNNYNLTSNHSIKKDCYSLLTFSIILPYSEREYYIYFIYKEKIELYIHMPIYFIIEYLEDNIVPIFHSLKFNFMPHLRKVIP